jgi:protein O-mannosyl-transferase
MSYHIPVAILLIALAVFGVSLNDPFHFDDVLILKDSNVTNASRWFHFFNPLHLRQLTFFTFYLNYLIGGDDSVGFHLVNLGLHIANAILLFYLLGQFLDRWMSGIAALIFLVHPVQTESVVYVYQRSVLLACFFSLLALIAFHRGRYGLAALLLFCAFESKESAIAVPAALALLYKHPARRWLVAGAAVGAVATLGLLIYQSETSVGIGAGVEVKPATYLAAQMRMIYTYIRLLFWPHPQSLEYEFPPAAPMWLLIAQAAGVMLLISTALWASMRQPTKLAGLAVLAFFILLAPTSSIIPSADAAFEHRLYLPMLAFSVFVASFLALLPRRVVVIAPLFAVLAVVSFQRVTVWASEPSLWEDTAAKAPGKARVWFNLGGAHLKDNPTRAKEAYFRALELEPFFPEVYYNLGVIEQTKGDYPAAIVHYQKAIDQDKGYWPAWNNLGNAFFAIGQRDRSLDCLETTLRLNPDYWPAQYNIAIVHFASGRYDRAIPRLRTVLDWKPDHREARQLLSIARGESGGRTAAEEQLRMLAADDSGVTP